jgi:hypothetical protein
MHMECKLLMNFYAEGIKYKIDIITKIQNVRYHILYFTIG